MPQFNITDASYSRCHSERDDGRAVTKLVIISVFAMAVGFVSDCVAERVTIGQTQSKIKRLDVQITQLKQTLAHSQDKRGTLNQELANTEKQIGGCVQKLNGIQQTVTAKQKNIATLQQRVKALNQQLLDQQDLLAQHVKARYKMSEYRPVIIALNQNDPYKINRLLTLYQYVVRSRQQIIDSMMKTQETLTHDQNALEQEIKEQQDLQQELHDQQQALERTKHYHQVLIKSLSEQIQTQQHTLAEFEQNKLNLSNLLQTLARESAQITHPTQPFTIMRHKLPFPVQVSRNAIQSMNQGVTFFANEGAPVHAVYPGRVVFSDWLKGYGLLVIIDHGQGFMTLYAHNQALFKAKGTQVAQGEQIATIGHSGGLKQNGLYFEVRQRGKAVSPQQWLRAN